MDKEKHKQFMALSRSQKRRRLNIARSCINDLDSQQNADQSNSSTENEAFHDQANIPHENIETHNTDSDDDIEMSDGEMISSSEGSSDTEVEEEEEAFLLEPVEQMEENLDFETNSEDNDDADQPPLPPPIHINEIKKKALKNVFLITNLKHTQIKTILRTLREFPFDLNYLPKDPRTLLQTPATIAIGVIQNIAGGEYLHVGFKWTLMKKLKQISANMLPESIIIDFSTDGAKVNKGSKQFWPIQYRVLNIEDKRPIIAGIFLGDHKPSNVFEFFEQFVHEVSEVRNNGILIEGRRIFLTIHCFIADAPARAFALNHAGHNSSKPCSKCKVDGRHYMNREIFEGTTHQLRSNDEYRNMVDDDHHVGRSPLNELLDLVTRVPFEAMHSLWLGNVRKAISANIYGKYKLQRMSARKMEIVNSRMLNLAMFCPSDFNRRPQKMSAFCAFKATEFRQIALYTAPSIFKNVFEDDPYKHFLLLHVVSRLLVSKATSPEKLSFCQKALETYVTLCEVIYGLQFLSYNIHCLLHLVSDVENLGDLESFSAFAYENSMPEFRKLIRKPGLPLEQYYKRSKELNDLNLTAPVINIHVRPSLPHAEGPIPENIPGNECQQFQKLEIGELTFATNERDSCCILQDTRVGMIRNILKVDEEFFFMFEAFRRKNSLYDVGVTSDIVGVYHCSFLSNIVERVSLNNVKDKCYRMPYWSEVEGQEEQALENEWICCSLLNRN